MLAGIYYGAQYGGSTTAILINMPGESSSAVTAIDGYQMARRGRAGAALSIAALGSFFAGTVSTFLRGDLRNPPDRACAEIRRRRVLLADDRRAGFLGRPCAWFDRQGACHGGARPAARIGRHGYLHGNAALYPRHSRICRWSEFRCRRRRRVRCCRDPAQSGGREDPHGTDGQGQRSVADARRTSGG